MKILMALLLAMMALNIQSEALAAPALIPTRLKISAAYETADRQLIMDLAATDSKAHPLYFPSGNTIFFGDGRRFDQLELKWNSRTEAATLVEFETGNQVGELDLNSSSPLLHCSSQPAGLRKLSMAEIQTLQARLSAGRIKLHTLPEVYDPAYVFRVNGRSDYVVVMEPRFNFHGNFQVYLGPLAKLKKVDLDQAALALNWRDQKPGVFQFAGGGGLYVPTSIDLFSSRKAQRGSPTLIRTPSADIETLVVPRLNKPELLRLGMSTKKQVPLKTPCSTTPRS